ncbi:MAG: hypothetical protein F6J93_00315 [Oscillatoria sp. SIO1A7]|nr:hypothetical protein [Oscillatoria sp. SIO1A7]
MLRPETHAAYRTHSFRKIIKTPQPMPNAPCPMGRYGAQCPMPNAQFPIPHPQYIPALQ